MFVELGRLAREIATALKMKASTIVARHFVEILFGFAIKFGRTTLDSPAPDAKAIDQKFGETRPMLDRRFRHQDIKRVHTLANIRSVARQKCERCFTNRFEFGATHPFVLKPRNDEGSETIEELALSQEVQRADSRICGQGNGHEVHAVFSRPHRTPALLRCQSILYITDITSLFS